MRTTFTTDSAARQPASRWSTAPRSAAACSPKGPDVTDRYFYRPAPPEIIEAAKRIQKVCSQHEVPLAAAALQFSMRDPRITPTIVGITKPDRVDQTIQLAEYPIPELLWQQLSPAPEAVWLS